jgi:uncharacterized membrane protein YecN with MAPEG domain
MNRPTNTIAFFFIVHFLFRHANLMENAPLTLLMLYIAESRNYMSSTWVAATAATFTVGRILHAYAFLGKHNLNTHLQFRKIGIVTSIGAQVGLAGIVLYEGISRAVHRMEKK